MPHLDTPSVAPLEISECESGSLSQISITGNEHSYVGKQCKQNSRRKIFILMRFILLIGIFGVLMSLVLGGLIERSGNLEKRQVPSKTAPVPTSPNRVNLLLSQVVNGALEKTNENIIQQSGSKSPTDYKTLLPYTGSGDQFKDNLDQFKDNLEIFREEQREKFQKCIYPIRLSSATFFDMIKIRSCYNGKNSCAGKTISCQNGGVPDVKHCSSCVCPLGWGGPACNKAIPIQPRAKVDWLKSKINGKNNNLPDQFKDNLVG